MIGSLLVEKVYANKKEFQEILCGEKINQPQFEIHMCFNSQEKLDCNPTIKDHRKMFEILF